MGGKIIGIDIGATKILVAVVQNSKVIKELSFPTVADAPGEEIISDIIEAINSISGGEHDGIGIGVPGLVDSDKGIVYDLSNIPSWKEVHLKKILEDHFHTPVKITNDANVFVLGEKIFGNGKSFRNMVGVTLGSGFGAGIIINDRLYSGAYSSAGEIGNIPYLDGTVEDYCSGKFFRSKYGVSGSELYDLAQNKDTIALKIFEEYGQHLGNALKLILYVLSPEAVLLGGSVSKSFPHFEISLLETLNSFPFQKVRDQLKVLASDTPNISVLGSAALIIAEQHEQESPSSEIL